MNHRGGFRFSHEAFKAALDLGGEVYAVQIDPATADVIVFCHNAGPATPEGAEAVVVRREFVKDIVGVHVRAD
jgi:hypothetical protein